MNKVDALKIKIFADGADIDSIVRLSKDPLIKGFTTNPSIMRKDGVTDYEAFARKLLKAETVKPISFEIFADDLDEMEAQARTIASWGKNIYVKIPVTNTKGQSTCGLISTLSQDGIALNVTAILTLQQVKDVTKALAVNTPAIVSVFAGRIADTSIDPVPLMTECLAIMQSKPKAELLWASPRELLNIFQADQCGCHIITVTYDMLKKLSLVDKDLNEYSLETVKMFYNDAVASNFKINTDSVAMAEA
jgi:transaldolase